MSKLSKQIEELQAQLDLSKQSESSMHIIREYSEIFSHLNTNNLGLKKLFDQFKALEEMPEPPIISDEVQSLAKATRTAFNSFYANWTINPQEARQGNELAIAKNSLESLVNRFNDELKHCWESWIKELRGNAILEEVLLDSQRLIPGKEAIYSEYVTKKSLFNEKIAKLPNESSMVTEIKLLSQRMIELIGQMEFKLPQDVKMFLEHLRNPQYGGKAPLKMLTKSVVDWLEVNKLTDKFVVGQIHRRF